MRKSTLIPLRAVSHAARLLRRAATLAPSVANPPATNGTSRGAAARVALASLMCTTLATTALPGCTHEEDVQSWSALSRGTQGLGFAACASRPDLCVGPLLPADLEGPNDTKVGARPPRRGATCKLARRTGGTEVGTIVQGPFCGTCSNPVQYIATMKHDGSPEGVSYSPYKTPLDACRIEDPWVNGAHHYSTVVRKGNVFYGIPNNDETRINNDHEFTSYGGWYLSQVSFARFDPIPCAGGATCRIDGQPYCQYIPYRAGEEFNVWNVKSISSTYGGTSTTCDNNVNQLAMRTNLKGGPLPGMAMKVSIASVRRADDLPNTISGNKADGSAGNKACSACIP